MTRLLLFAFVTFSTWEAVAAETPKEILALRIKDLGYPCISPLAANHDLQRVEQGEVRWMLLCTNATYRLGVIADMRAPIRVHEALVYDRFFKGSAFKADIPLGLSFGSKSLRI